jgi:phosphoglycerol transferase MdoB-like AlkP superfamily enzyme
MGPFSWLCYITGECINYLAMNIKAIKTEALLGTKESNRNLQVIHLTHLQLLPILTKKIVKKSLRIYTKHTQNMQKIQKKKARTICCKLFPQTLAMTWEAAMACSLGCSWRSQSSGAQQQVPDLKWSSLGEILMLVK